MGGGQLPFEGFQLMFKQLRKWRGSLFPQTKVAAPSCAFERLEDRQLLSAAISSISADNRGMVMLGVTQDLNPSTVNSKTVQILVGGLDGQLGTKDDLRKRASVKYSQDTDTITISAKVPVNVVLAWFTPTVRPPELVAEPLSTVPAPASEPR